MAPTRIRQAEYCVQPKRRVRNVMKTKLAMITMVGVMLVPAVVARAQWGPFDDPITTWISWDPEGCSSSSFPWTLMKTSF